MEIIISIIFSACEASKPRRLQPPHDSRYLHLGTHALSLSFKCRCGISMVNTIVVPKDRKKARHPQRSAPNPLRSGAEHGASASQGIQLTSFTGTKVQILTQKALLVVVHFRVPAAAGRGAGLFGVWRGAHQTRLLRSATVT
jgi:hypothetical protein